MTLDEAIKHAEEVAKKQENNAKIYPRPDKSVKGSGRKYNAYLKCAEEHRQLAEWLKDYKRLLEQGFVLDKIRAEIDEQYDRVHPYNISCAEGLEMALDIIDKYKAESEVQDADSD